MFFLETKNINQLVVNPKKIQNKLTRNEFLLLFIKIEIIYSIKKLSINGIELIDNKLRIGSSFSLQSFQ
jgi:hypothetical protein